MPNVLGISESYVLFQDSDNAVVVDKDLNLVVETGDVSALFASRKWNVVTEEISASVSDLALGALADLEIRIVASGSRMYTIPKGVQNEAKNALEWRKEHKRGGTPVGMNTARTLSKGGQIGIEKIRHIAKYFPRHEIDKKAKGFEPGEPNFPSRGRIAWALWGGDAGWRWAQSIVERENKKAITADGYATQNYSADYAEYEAPRAYKADIDAFKQAYELDPMVGPEFLARVRLDGSGIDRLYKIDLSGNVYVWDDNCWDDLGHVDSDIWTYDKALDDPYDRVKKSHIVIDPDSAIIVSARMQESPFSRVTVDEIDADETRLVSDAISEVDWTMVDYAITAAGENVAAPAAPEGDGNYTPEERAKNARKQVRDKGGKFAAQGSRVVIGGDTQNGVGYIRSINPETQSVSVKLDNGQTVDVPANTTEKAEVYVSAIARETPDVPALDTTGILAQPRTPIDRPNAQIPGTLPALKPQDMADIVNNYPAWVKSQRDQFKEASAPVATPTGGNLKATTAPAAPAVDPRTPFDKADAPTITKGTQDLLKQTGAKITLNAYDHPLLKNFLNKTVKAKDGTVTNPNRLWYQPVTSKPVTSAGTPIEETDVAKPNMAEVAAEELTPDNSDVQPLFLALVSPDDPRAVMDLVGLVPASSKSNTPMTYKRVKGEWVRDEGILADLNSVTPPPVVPLDDDTLTSVLEQVDSGTVVASAMLAGTPDHIITVLWGPMTAAGGADRNRGNAEALRRYWTVGKGAAKIRWGTKGDWTRCVRQLSKYMGPRAKGYCSLRHHEVTGMWTGDKAHTQLFGRKGGRNMFSTEVIASHDEVIEKAALKARSADAKARMTMIAAGTLPEPVGTGAKFVIPLVIPENKESGDGRKFKNGAIDIRELPLPLMWQIKTGEGHMGSVVVGRIDHMERTAEGIGNATGVFDTGEYGKEAERLVREGFIRGVSADMDKFEAMEEPMEAGAEEDDAKVGNSKMSITQARVMGVTIVPKPAFQECKIILVEDETQVQEDSVIPDGVYVEDVDPAEAEALVACGMVAGSIPVVPPKNWFENPQLKKATPLTVDDEGRVFGHIAAWHVDHIGMHTGTKPPRSKSKYAYFHTGVVRTDDGTDVPVGQLTLAGGHASLHASAQEAARHYDDTASAISDVHAGEDAFGIWVAGALRPGVTPEQVRALRASAPSGDWRPIKGQLELVAVCQVNVPGFPIARARVASGQVMALVAAGAQTLARMKSDPVAELAARVHKLEQLEQVELSAKVDAARARFAPIREARKAELSARMAELSARVKTDLGIDEFEDGFGYISREKRQKLADEGKALPDGSFPITNVDSLKDSISAYGRGKPSKRAAIRRHIMKRARVLDRADLIPENWKAMSSEELEFSIENLRSRIPSITASADAQETPTKVRWSTLGKASAAEFGNEPGFYTPETQPRDAKGKFRTVLARIKQNLGDSGLQDVVDKVEETENLDNAGNYLEAARSATDLIGIIDRIDSGALNPEALTNVRESARALGGVIANLPLPFGEDAQKVRFSDLPPALRDLVENMITRVEDKIGKKDADVASEKLRKYIGGGDVLNQGEVSSEMSKMLRLLT